MFTATITTKGQITLPKAVRERLGLKEGDQVIFVPAEGRFYLYPVHRTGLEALRGIFKGSRPYPGRDVERAAAREAAVAEVMRWVESDRDADPH